MSTKRLAAVTLGGICLVLVAFPVAQSSSVIGRFAGTWKEDVSKRKVGSGPNLRFQRNDKGILQEARGPEVRPVFQTVVFDGKPHKLDEGTNSIIWKQINETTFERVLTDAKGQPLTVRRIRISADGKTLTEDTERKLTDGRTSVDTFVYQRVSGDPQGLVGRWNAQSFKTTNPSTVKYEPAGANGLKFSDVNNEPTDTTYTVAFDGNPVSVVGSAVIAGTMTAAKAVDDRTIEFTQSREGVVSAKSVRTVSSDGKMLTVTNTTVGPNSSSEPSVFVYVKQ